MRTLLLRSLWLACLVGLAARAFAATAGVFNVLDYGARNDGSVPATDAFRAAIQAAKTGGGGTVVVPPGTYTCGPIELVSNLTLEIQAGAVLAFPPARLPFTRGRVQGIECLTPVPLIGGANLENVTITGRGTITTDNAAWVKLFGAPQPKTTTSAGSAFGPKWNELLANLQKQTPRPESEYLAVAPFLRPAFIRFTDSRHIAIEGIRMLGSSFWSIHLLYSQDALVHNVTLETFPGIFTGGIYIDSTRDVRVSDCFLDCGDDAIVLKAGKDADGLRVNRPTENVTVTNCVVHRGSGGIVIGSETSGWIRNIVVNNLVCHGTQAGINIKSERGRGGGVENVQLDNLVFDDVGRAITVSEYYTMQGETPPGDEPVSARTPTFRNIAISRVTIHRARGAFDFSWNPVSTSGNKVGVPIAIEVAGLPERPIEGLRISDIVATGKGGLRVRGADGLEVRNVQMTPDSGVPFVLRDSRNLRLVNLATRAALAPDVPVIRLDDCPGAVVSGGGAYDASAAHPFLSVGPGEAKQTTLEPARAQIEERAADFWTNTEERL